MTMNSSAEASPHSLATNSRQFLRWLVCLSASLFFFYAFIQMNMFDAISSDLMAGFNITSTQLGILSSTFLFANMLFLYPAGIMLDHLSTRKIIIGAMGVCVASTFLFSIAPNFILASIAHFITGISNAFCFLSCMILATRWFPPKRLAFVTGLIVTIAMVGGAMAHTPLEIITQAVGWRDAMILNGLLGVALLVVIWWFVQDAPDDSTHPKQLQQQPFSLESFLTHVRASIANPQNWKAGIFISALNMPLMVLGALWGTLYLHQADHFSTQQATTISSMLFIGTIAGSPIFGAISDRLQRRKLPMIVGASLSLLTFIFIMMTHHINFNLAIASFFALGFFTSAQIIGYPLITESNPKPIIGTSLGLGSILIMGGAGLCQQLFGFLIDYFWDHKLWHHIPLYSQADFEISMLLFPVVLIIGLAMAFSVKETHCTHHQQGD